MTTDLPVFSHHYTNLLSGMLVQVDALQFALQRAVAAGIRRDEPKTVVDAMLSMLEDLLRLSEKPDQTLRSTYPQLNVMRMLLKIQLDGQKFITGTALLDAIKARLRTEALSTMTPEQFADGIQKYKELRREVETKYHDLKPS